MNITGYTNPYIYRQQNGDEASARTSLRTDPQDPQTQDRALPWGPSAISLNTENTPVTGSLPTTGPIPLLPPGLGHGTQVYFLFYFILIY